jgi:LPXTG-motif cell wall-anchored protein
MLAPQYWAGLVIIGDISPIQLKQKTSFWFLSILGFILLFAGGFFALKRKRI